MKDLKKAELALTHRTKRIKVNMSRTTHLKKIVNKCDSALIN